MASLSNCNNGRMSSVKLDIFKRRVLFNLKVSGTSAMSSSTFQKFVVGRRMTVLKTLFPVTHVLMHDWVELRVDNKCLRVTIEVVYRLYTRVLMSKLVRVQGTGLLF